MAEPAGLGMSLDDLITRQQTQQGQGGGYGKQRRERGPQREQGGGGRLQHDRGQGRGGRHGGVGGRGGRGGRRFDGDGGSGGGGGHWQEQQHGQQHHRQQQQQQQQQYNLRQQAFDPNAYREHQSCRQEESGDVVFRFMRTTLVRIDAAGNITLTSGGHHNGMTLASLNDALNLIGIRVTCPSGDVHSGEWSISDGRTLTRFSDGVVLPAKGTQHVARGRQLLQAFNAPNHLQQAVATAASNAAATMAGIVPFSGFVPPGVPASRQQAPVNGGGGGGGRGSVFARLGGRQGQQTQQRFSPY